MFQFLSIMIFFASILYGAWYLFWDEQKSSVSNLSYEEFLQEALERNIKSYDVVFERSEFISLNSKNNWTNSTQNTSETEWDTSWNYIVVESSTAIKVEAPNEIVSSKNWNFWTPEIPSEQTKWAVNCEGWLLYDPCLVVGDPVKASWDMYFGSNKRF